MKIVVMHSAYCIRRSGNTLLYVLDADDELASYAITFYLEKFNNTDGLIAPIHSFTTQRPQFVDLDRVRVEYFNAKGNINSF